MNKKKLITSRIIDLFESVDEILFLEEFCYFDLNEKVYANRSYSTITFPTCDTDEYHKIY